MPVTVKRKDIRFNPDPSRIITRFHLPVGNERIWSISDRVLRLSDEEVNLILNNVLRNFSKRHRNVSKIFENNFNRIKFIITDMNPGSMDPHLKKKIQNLKILLKKFSTGSKPESKKRKLLIGAYFTMEYSIESAAFFNPSIVEHPDQTDLLEKNQKRVIISFRATGEGHISSLVFREGVIDKDNNIDFKSIGRLVDVPEVVKRHVYEKEAFFKKIHEMNIYQYIHGSEKEPAVELIENTIKLIMDKLEDKFIYGTLRNTIEGALKNPELTVYEKRIIEAISWLADSHYEISIER